MDTEQDLVLTDKNKQKAVLDLLIIAVWMVSAKFDIMEQFVSFARRHEHWEIDEVAAVSLYVVFALAYFSWRRWKESAQANGRLLKSNRELSQALSEIKQLKGLIPICASCKKIRDDHGYWHQVEAYIREHSEATFSHSICPECFKKYYPDLFDEQGT